MASLPVTIYQYAGSAFEDWVQLAWVGALPRTPLGKPQKFLLREQMRAMVASAGTE